MALIRMGFFSKTLGMCTSCNVILPQQADPDAPALLEPESPVSMNFWGFGPGVFGALERSFNLFVKEQIMPEKADANWPLGAGVTEEQRGEIAKTLGNFIILREKLQPKAKKAAWLDKKADMKPKCEELDLFKCVQNGLRTWDEKIVEERNAWLADKILDTWSK